jgi:ribonuclease P protein component
LPGQSDRKIGFAAVRAVGHAVCRHRHIRKLREFYRLNKDLFPDGSHYLLLMRRSVEDWKAFEERLHDLISSLRSR